MFWQKNKKNSDWGLIMFGFIALGIIISSAILIILLSKKANNWQRQQTNKMAVVSDIYNKVLPVKENYLAKMLALEEKVASLSTTAEIYQELENVFLQVRVPQDKLDAHLSAWLKIDKWRTENKLNALELKNEVGVMLSKLSED